ncbi:MAG: class I SAM-dependent methyltransferase [Minisyncoccia bacterium]
MFFILKEISKGKSLARALFNAELSAYTIKGRTLDVGGGKHQDYLEFLNMNETASVETVDIASKEKGAPSVDFEKDPLPFPDGVMDSVLVFNVLEHIYNYHFLVCEMRRVLKNGGQLVGFVPFLVNYHPDPHDYFRYTKEALQKILEDAGFRSIRVKEVGRGPFAVNYNNLALSLPLTVRMVLLPFWYVADTIFLALRPKVHERYPLGYMFVCQK